MFLRPILISVRERGYIRATPVIQEGYNAVIVNDDGINFITQNFGPLSKVNSSILQITSEDLCSFVK